MHTPGPWHQSDAWERPGIGAYVRSDVENRPVCSPIGGTSLPDEEVFANARLIAAAPELLAACELVLDSTPDDEEDYRPILRAAIKKAKGE